MVGSTKETRRMARLFISQARLDNWSVEDRVRVDGDVMTLSGDGRSFKIKPAVRFLKVSGDSSDPNDFLGRVLTVQAIVEKGGEHYMDSVLLGDTAYDVQCGFIGEPMLEAQADVTSSRG
jgi:hypothetical protein